MEKNFLDKYYVYFLKVNEIRPTSDIFTEFTKAKFHFSYFILDNNYYLFCYGKGDFNELTKIFKNIDIFETLNKKRRISGSLIGFFIYVREVMQNSENVKILRSNLHPLFWKDIGKIIAQNEKKAFLDFLAQPPGCLFMEYLYNSKKHRQLLNNSKILQKEGKNMEGKDSHELDRYTDMVFCKLNWENRNQYLKIFKDFLENKTSSEIFFEELKNQIALSEQLSRTGRVSELQFLTVDQQRFSRILDQTRSDLPSHFSETEVFERVKQNFFKLTSCKDSL